MQASECAEGWSEPLLPGIPDEVTFGQIMKGAETQQGSETVGVGADMQASECGEGLREPLLTFGQVVKGAETQQGNETVGVGADMQASECGEGLTEPLLPGIPDEVTFGQIVPKLPWRAFHKLSCVSPTWLRAIRTHQVQDARVRPQSAEALVLVTHICPGSYDDLPRSKKKADFDDEIALYSMRDNTHSQLPRIPGLPGRIPPRCQCVALDGKVYVLGGEEWEFCGFPSNKVYVLDLAGQMQWKACASMKEPRMMFGCGVINGKIYVFGGRSCHSHDGQPIYGSEMYDAKENIWSPIMPMPTLRYRQFVTRIGEELFLHGGMFFDSDFVAKRSTYDYTSGADYLEIYHPVKNEWRVVKPFGRRCEEDGGRSPLCEEVLFVARDRFYSMSQLGIHVHDGVGNSWKHLQSISSLYVPLIGLVATDVYGCDASAGHTVINFSDRARIWVFSVQSVNDEVLVIFYWYRNGYGCGFCLVESRGFSKANLNSSQG